MASDTETLASLHRGEISATETFNQALAKFKGLPEETEVTRMRDEHREAANSLRQHIHQQGGEPASGSGIWGAWAKCVEGTAKIFGKTAALKALKEGEEHGLKDYQSALTGVDANSAQLIQNQLIPAQQRHINLLDQLIGSVSKA